MLGQPPAASAQAGAGTAPPPHLWVLGGQWALAPGGAFGGIMLPMQRETPSVLFGVFKREGVFSSVGLES